MDLRALKMPNSTITLATGFSTKCTVRAFFRTRTADTKAISSKVLKREKGF
jgi:hypothetical protein